jgi:Bacterial membrane protein YfhO
VRWPWLLVAAAVAWNLASLRAETLSVAYLDDSSLHEQMVRFATAQLRAGHLPLTSWFPYLGLGSPQFLHYQSLPGIVAGAIGLVIGPSAAFRWTLYLLLSLWPVSVYAGARLLGVGRGAAAASAAMAPFPSSVIGIGYEQHAYVWSGFGVWTQLWASVTLPLAWGFSWRWIRDGRHALAAVTLSALTIALHFETGYLALIPLLLWPFVADGPLAGRSRRAAIALAGALLASAWVIVPLLDQRAWAAQNEVLRNTPPANGYGAGRVLGWLVSGQLLDHGRLPVVTAFAALGLVLAIRRRRDADARALLVALVICLLLSFGRATFGSLVALIPGSGDIFFRRFMMGVQLAALLLAGVGGAWVGRLLWERVPASARRPSVLGIVALTAAVIVLAPAWIEFGRYDRRNASAIAAQRRADATQGAELGRLLARIRRNAGGRVYAGEPTNWGASFTVGAVPVFKYLESQDIDEVGYTLRTASLMTDPEYFFDDTDPSDYVLFGIRYLIVPAGYEPPVRATFTARTGPYALWTLPGGGYVHTATITGTLPADRADVGVRSIALLHSPLAQHGQELRVLWSRGRPKPLPLATATRPPGTLLTTRTRLAAGLLDATVRMRRPGVTVLSASYDPGWTATVDGRPAPTVIVAPALVAARVPAGTHRVAFRYRGYRDYPLLFAVCAVTLLTLLGYERARLRLSRA